MSLQHRLDLLCMSYAHRTPFAYKRIPMIALLGLLTVQLSVQAAERDELTLYQALERTLQHSPAIQQQPLAMRQAALHRLAAAVTPPPEVAVNVSNLAGTTVHSRGLQAAELSISFGQLLEHESKQVARIAQSEAATAALTAQHQVEQMELLATTIRAYQQVQYLQLLTDWTQQRLTTEQQILNSAAQRQAAAALLAADVSRLKLRVTLTQQQLEQLHTDHQQARMTLAALWGATPAFTRVESLSSKPPQLPAWSAVFAQIQQSPQLHRWLSTQRLADAERRLARVNQQNDWRVEVGITRDQGLQDTSLSLSFSRPLAMSQPQQLAQAELAVAQQELSNSLNQQQLQLRLSQLYQHLERQISHLNSWQHQVIPQAEQFVSHSQQAWQQGLLSTNDWLAARQELLQTERDWIDLRHAVALWWLELQLLSGHPLQQHPATSMMTAPALNSPSNAQAIPHLWSQE